MPDSVSHRWFFTPATRAHAHDAVLTTYATAAAPLSEELREVIRTWDEPVTSRDLSIIERCWGLRSGSPDTVEGIAAAMGIPPSQVRQIRADTMGVLRRAFRANEPPSTMLISEITEYHFGVVSHRQLLTALARQLQGGEYQLDRYIAMVLQTDAVPRLWPYAQTLSVSINVSPATLDLMRVIISKALTSGEPKSLTDLTSIVASDPAWPNSDGVPDVAEQLVRLDHHEVLPDVFCATPWTYADYARFYGSGAVPLSEELRTVASTQQTGLTARDLLICERYWGLRTGRPDTLEEIGADLGLTHERIRQLRDRAVKRIRLAFLRAQPSSVMLMRVIAQQHAGVVARAHLVDGMAAYFSGGEYQCDRYASMLLEIEAVPQVYQYAESLCIASQIVPATVDSLRERISGALTGVKAAALLDLAEIVEAFLADFFSGYLFEPDDDAIEAATRALLTLDHYEVLPGLYSASRWQRAELAQFVLEQEGRALHFTEIAKRIEAIAGSRGNAPAINSLLNSHPAFVRVGAGDFALAQWGARRYGRFDEVIERYLASGRIAEHLGRIETDLLETYTVSPSTIAAMLIRGRATFIHYGGGHWGLRGYSPVVDPHLVAAVRDLFTAAGTTLTAEAVTTTLRKNASWHHLSGSELLRVLYVCSQFRRSGSYRNRTFALS